MKERAKDVVRKLRREAAQPRWRHSKAIRWAIGILLTLAVAGLFPRPHSQALTGYSVGSLWTSEDVLAPFSYPIKKDTDQYRHELAQAIQGASPVYLLDTTARNASIKQLVATIDRLTLMLDSARTDTLKQVALQDSMHELGFKSEDWQSLLQFEATQSRTGRNLTKSPLQELAPSLVKILNAVESDKIIVKPAQDGEAFPNSTSIALRTKPSEETLLPRNTIITTEEAANQLQSEIEKRLASNPGLVRALSKVTGASLVPTANYSADLTNENLRVLEQRVLRTEGIVKEGQRIVSRGDVITAQSKGQLESLEDARLTRGGESAQVERVIGTIGHAAVIILLVVLYLRFIRRRIYNDNAQLLLLSLILLFPAVMAYLSVRIHLPFPLEYLILIPVASMLLTILFDSRTGFYGTVVSALIVAGIRGNDYSVALAGLAAGAFAAYTVRDLRSRGQLFQSIAYIFLGYVIAISALALERSSPIGDWGMQVLAALINALVSPVLTLGVLYAVESIFDTMSDLKLTEFDTINHPLLRELALRAPGTYQHTMLVAQLSENAAIAIGANGLLAKVGAYFHDIGKLTEPKDFIENQTAEMGNVHSSLAPEESAERIRNHVLEGIALARVHNLPEKLIEFIPMHHGTRRISFFYEEALAQKRDVVLNEASFHYPGPKPSSKETAIVMLADAAEAVARSVAQHSIDPSLETMEMAIDRLFRQRFDEGQLDDCDLTIRDLTIVRAVFARLLVGMHHARIVYPVPAQKNDSKNDSKKRRNGEHEIPEKALTQKEPIA